MRPFICSGYTLFLGSLLLISVTHLSCKGGLDQFNLLSIEQDIELGREVEKEIASKPGEYPILPESGNEQAYTYIRNLKDQILNSGHIQYRNEFPWTVRIIHQDSILNAFCAPGGFIYVYTGLIKFLDTEDQLSGVMGHEIAHADLRHSSRQLTKIMGVSLVIDALLGKDLALLSQIATTLIALSFSREHETESDLASVKYLCPTDLNAAGAAGFFKKLEGTPSPPEFLSTHPDPGNRVTKIENEKIRLGCKGNAVYDARYAAFKALLP